MIVFCVCVCVFIILYCIHILCVCVSKVFYIFILFTLWQTIPYARCYWKLFILSPVLYYHIHSKIAFVYLLFVLCFTVSCCFCPPLFFFTSYCWCLCCCLCLRLRNVFYFILFSKHICVPCVNCVGVAERGDANIKCFLSRWIERWWLGKRWRWWWRKYSKCDTKR